MTDGHANGLNGHGLNGHGSGQKGTEPEPEELEAGPESDRYSWTKAAWLEAYRLTRDCQRASASVGVSFRAVTKRRARDPQFKAACAAMKRELFEELEDSVAQRVLHGVRQDIIECVAEIRKRDPQTGETKVVRKFEKVGERVTYPDVLTIFYMKAHKPEVYSERAMSARALADDPDEVRVNASVNLRELSAEGREGLRTFLREQALLEAASRESDPEPE